MGNPDFACPFMSPEGRIERQRSWISVDGLMPCVPGIHLTIACR